MSFGIYEASVPVFSNALGNMRDWLGKAAQELDEATRPIFARGEGP